MSHKPPPGTRTVPIIPDHIAKSLRDKDRIIKAQSKRIQSLENEVDRLRKDRDSLSTKVTLLSYKLEMNSQSKSKILEEGDSHCGGSEGSSGHTQSSQSPSHRPGGADSPVRYARAGPTDGFHSPSPMGGTPGHHGNSGLRQRSQKRESDDKLKKSRAWANAYELSQDLHDKQLEMLERKYGGHIRTRRAARVIQQAYRHYRLNKNFDRLRSELEDKRLRRLSEFGRSKTIWTDMVASIEEKANMHSNFFNNDHFGSFANHQMVSYSDHFQKKTLHTSSVHSSSMRTVRVIHKSHSMNVMSKDTVKDRHPLQRSSGIDLDTILENSRIAKLPNVPSTAVAIPVASLAASETNNNRNSYPELNDSSCSTSPQDNPVEPTLDLPSVNFENLLESKETDILNDSFHSDSSQDVCNSPRTTQPRYNNHVQGGSSVTVGAGGDEVESEQNDTLRAEHVPDSLAVGSDGRTSCTPKGRVEIHVEEPTESSAEAGDAMVSSFSEDAVDGTLLHEDETSYTRIYHNTEVKLRKRKDGTDKNSPDASPIWKRKSAQLGPDPSSSTEDIKRMSNISEASEPESIDGLESREGCSPASSDSCSMGSDSSHTYHRAITASKDSPLSQPLPPRLSDRQRKRMYRIGLNLFNKKPEKGVRYLVDHRFLENRPQTVAKFLISRKGLSKQMIGEYLGNLQKQFNMDVLGCFCREIDLAGVQVDVALRKFQGYFRMPGEAQKIERLMEAFANRYCECNPDQVKQFSNVDTIFLLAFAIIMLNTDLHNKSIKAERKMKLSDFIKNLKGIDGGEDLDPDLLLGIYDRIKATAFKPGADHVMQVNKVEQMIAGKKPPLSLPHRRLVCYCRLYEVLDPNRKEKLGLHQREVFLFNDMLMVTKIFSKKKNNVMYSFRHSFSLCGMVVYLFQTPHYKYGIRLTTNINGKVLINFNARNEHDQNKFVEDLKEAILEMNEMETLRIEEELQKQKVSQSHKSFNRHSKDSGVVDIELLKPSDPTGFNRLSAPECGGIKKTTLSNSLIDLSEGTLRRSSGGSLDSGMVSAGSGSQEDNHAAAAVQPTPFSVPSTQPQPSSKTLKVHSSSSSKSGFFGRKKKSSKTSLVDSSEV